MDRIRLVDWLAWEYGVTDRTDLALSSKVFGELGDKVVRAERPLLLDFGAPFKFEEDDVDVDPRPWERVTVVLKGTGLCLLIIVLSVLNIGSPFSDDTSGPDSAR